MNFEFSHMAWVYVIIPIDEVILFRGVAKNHQPVLDHFWRTNGGCSSTEFWAVHPGYFAHHHVKLKPARHVWGSPKNAGWMGFCEREILSENG